jgi:polysaccharide export outer membrane protein
MPKLGLIRRAPRDPESAARCIRPASLLVACAVCLGGCAGSSANSTATSYSGAGDPGAPAYRDDASGPPANASAFAPTAAAAAAARSNAASEAADKLTSVAMPGNAAYRIGPLDVLDVSVFKVPDLAKTVQVSEDGTINYPLVGTVPAAGKTAKQVEQDLSQQLGAKYLRSPQVTVLVKEFNSQRVTVEGSVKTTGVYAIKGKTTLMQVLAMAGDVDMSVASGDIVVFRTINGQRSAAKFDADAIKSGKAEDPQMEPGDVVVVNTSDTKVALQNVLKVLPLATTAAFISGL